MRSSVRALVSLIALSGIVAACGSVVAGQAVPGPSVVLGTAPTPQPGSAITVPSNGPGGGASSSVASSTGASSTTASSTAAPPPASSVSASDASPTSDATSGETTAPPTDSGGPAVGTPDGSIGAVGIGDPYYPDAGNGGYQVTSYDIGLTYDPATNALSATTTIVGTVTETTRLGRFDLDLQPTMNVTEVRVNGAAANFQHRGAELVITPTAGLAPGAALSVTVAYSGQPTDIPGGTAGLGDGGWYRTPSGGAIAIGEPFSASAWYPVNEHPSDPATYRVTATVPAKWSVISNGIAATTGLPSAPAGMKVFRWTQAQPVTSYESTIYIDTFSTVTSATADGKPIVSVFAPTGNTAKYKTLAQDTAQILQVLANHYGPYPFSAAGGIYTGQNLSFALETATRPVYADWVNTDTIVHELTHQWFGDDVVIQRWSDICLNECFASYGPWLWYQDTEKADLDAEWVDEMAQATSDPDFWSSPLVDMGPGQEFTSVYTRGPLAVHALRKEMGEKAFATFLRGWPAANADRAVSWDDFVAYVNKLAGRDLTSFVDAWFRGTTVPAAQFRHPGGLGR